MDQATRLVLCACWAACGASIVRAQCMPAWQQGTGVPGVRELSENYAGGANAQVNACVMWDPDGAGSLPKQPVFGGAFQFAGRVRAQNIATWNGTEWQSLDSGLGTYVEGGVTDIVYALAGAPDGRLIAGGVFSNAGEVEVFNIAVWNGSDWTPIGDGLANGVVQSLLVRPNGNIIAVGQAFEGANGIVMWNGVDWDGLGTGLESAGESGYGSVLAALPNGDILVGGYFDHAGGVPANGIAQLHFETENNWTWTPLGSGLDPSGSPLSIYAAGMDDVYVGGSFETAGGISARNVAHWNGQEWSSLAEGLDSSVTSLVGMPNGDIVAVGAFLELGGSAGNYLARWDGEIWSAMAEFDEHILPLSQGRQPICAMTDTNGDFVVGGVIRAGVLRWDGARWSHYGDGFDGEIDEVIQLSNGDLVVSGNFMTAPGTDARHIARFDGSTWHSLNNGLSYWPSALMPLPDGGLIVSGYDSESATLEVLQWNGSQWATHSTGVQAFAFGLLSNGDLVATGIGADLESGVFLWNGSSWNMLGSAFRLPSRGSRGYPMSLTVLSNDDIVVGGWFECIGDSNCVSGIQAKNVARWDGSNWNVMGGGLGFPAAATSDNVSSIVKLPNDDVVACGWFLTEFGGGPQLNHVARWDGASWLPMGNGIPGSTYVFDATTRSNGNVCVSGSIPGGTVAEWDGSAWSHYAPALNGTTYAVLGLANDSIAAGGSFTFAGLDASAYFAIRACGGTTCDSIDFNNDTSFFDPQDIDAFLSVYSEGPCIPEAATCDDIDFNNDTSLFDPCDIDSFLLMYSEGPCTPCGQ